MFTPLEKDNNKIKGKNKTKGDDSLATSSANPDREGSRTGFTGSIVALVTPFKDGLVDYDKLGELVEYHIENHAVWRKL